MKTRYGAGVIGADGAAIRIGTRRDVNSSQTQIE
jgi:hypothetical protein